jgi:hypothetical protein
MAIRKPGFVKKCGYIGIIASMLLIVSIIVTGCTQTSTNSGQPAAAVSPGTSGNSVPPVSIAVSPNGTGVPGGAYMRGHFVRNETPLMAAAQTLGVSESDLIAALAPPPQSHVVNYTYSAAQLSAASGTTITPAQLMAALGEYQGSQ